MYVFFAGSTLADNDAKLAPNKKKNSDYGRHKHYLEEAILKMVQEGSLTGKADKILNTNKIVQNRQEGILNELIKQGIITEVEANAIKKS